MADDGNKKVDLEADMRDALAAELAEGGFWLISLEEAAAVVIPLVELGALHGMAGDVNKGSDNDIEREMRDKAVDAEVRSVGNDEAEYEDCEVMNDPTPDEEDVGAVAGIIPVGLPALLDVDVERLVAFSYVCINEDDAKIEEGPKAALGKLLSELSASGPLEVEVE